MGALAPTPQPQATPLSQAMDPVTLAMFLASRTGLGAQPSGPPSPYAQQLQQMGQQVLPKDIAGALSSATSKYDEASRQKIEAIQRAKAALQAAANPQGNLAMFRAGTAMMAPTRTGSFGEAMYNSDSAYADAIEKQREFERQMAASTGQYDVDAATAAQEGAAKDVDFLDKRLDLSSKLTNQAATADWHNQNVNARYAAILGRLTTAEMSKNKNRYKYLGVDPSDRSKGVYMDTQSGQTMLGAPAASGSALTTQERFSRAVTEREHAISGEIGAANLSKDEIHAAALDAVSKELAAGGPEAGGGDQPAAAAPEAPAVPAPAGPAAQAPQAPAKKPTAAQEKAFLDQAQSAIARGAPADAVRERLKALGVDPKKLDAQLRRGKQAARSHFGSVSGG